MEQIQFKQGLHCEISNNRSLRIQRYNHLYTAAILHKDTLKMETSKEYVKPQSLNNFLKSYDIELVF